MGKQNSKQMMCYNATRLKYDHKCIARNCSLDNKQNVRSTGLYTIASENRPKVMIMELSLYIQLEENDSIY
ncbi:MAG: hypothetical protein AB7V56_04535 [Candidatus Nitrosocosmicus sp.]